MRGCPDPVFVCGCPRSGTTSVWQALLQHPSLSPPPEKQHSKEHWFFVEFFAGRYEHNLANRANELDKIYVGEAIGFINDFMTRHLSSPTGRYLTAHPDNIFYVREILRHIPKAQFLFLVRHPQENVWSMLNAPFAVEAGWRDSIESTDRFTDDEIRRTTGYWKRSAQVIIDALRGEFGSSVFIIRQEEMIERPIELAREVLEFLGEPFVSAVAQSLADRIINSSFGLSGGTLQITDDQQRRAYYDGMRAQIATRKDFCSVVFADCEKEMRALNYKDYCANTDPTPGSIESFETKEAPSAAKIVKVSLVGVDNQPLDRVSPDEDVILKILIVAYERVSNLSVGFVLHGDMLALFGTTTFDEYVELPDLSAGERLEVSYNFKQILPAGRYVIDVHVNSVSSRNYLDNVLHHHVPNACRLETAYSPARPIHYKFHNPVTVEFVKL